MARRVLRAALAAALACGSMVPAARAASFDVAIFHSERDALADAFKFWAAEIDKRTQGRVQFKPSYSGALTSAVETLGAVRNGVVPVGLTAASFSSGAMPFLGYLEAVGGIPNEPEPMRKALDALHPTVADLLRRGGVELMFMQPTYDVITVCSAKHLKSPADWRGIKIRAAGRWQSQQVQALGASPTAIDPGEQYLALQNKTVDCALSVPNLAVSLKLYEVAPKITMLRQGVNVSMYIMNTRSWASIAPADQAIVRAVSTEAMHRSIVHLQEIVAKAMADMKALGADVYVLDDGELKATKEKMQDVFGKIADGSGEAGKSLAAQLKPYW
jgi:TRAP-type C4-dicarboxylate transport system substrate-binding protein